VKKKNKKEKKRKLSLPVGRGTPKATMAQNNKGFTHSFACRCFLVKGCLL
jgi:hypothetical protein